MKSIFLLFTLCFFGLSFGQTGTWDFDKSPMPVNTGGSAVELVDGMVFVIGGWRALPEKPDSTFAFSSIQVYNPLTDSWDTTRAKMPTPRFNCGSAVVGKKIYIFGGNPYSNVLEVYNTVTDTWETDKTEMRYSNTGSMATAIDGLIYVGGAWDTEQKIAESFVSYNPETDEYSVLSSIPYPVGHASLEVIDGRIYLFGGINTQSNPAGPIKKIQVYDPNTDSWNVLPFELPEAYWTMGSFHRGSQVYFMGTAGERYSDGFIEVCGDIIMVDLAHQLCRKIGAYPYNYCYTPVIDLEDEVLIFGGYNSDDRELSSIEMVSSTLVSYTPVSNPIYPHTISVDRVFCSLGDSILMTCHFVNESEQAFTAVCQVNDVGDEIRDQFDLFDDGLHGDSNANDGIYGTYIPMEHEYEGIICIETSNQTNEEEFSCLELQSITSIGPVVFSGVQYFSADTIPDPGDAIRLRPLLINHGQMAAATQVSARFYSIDEKLILPDYSSGFADLIPNDEPKMGSHLMTLRLSEDCVSGEELRLGVEISSRENLFWRDTVYIKIGQGFLLAHEDTFDHNIQGIEMNIFPNPASDDLFVTFYSPEMGSASLQILDLRGRVIEVFDHFPVSLGINTFSLNLKSLPPNVYLIKLVSDMNIVMRKLIKQ